MASLGVNLSILIGVGWDFAIQIEMVISYVHFVFESWQIQTMLLKLCKHE